MSKKRGAKGNIPIIAVAAVGILLWFARGESAANSRLVIIGDAAVSVETAVTAAEKEQGLSKHLSLADNEGMLFVYDKPETPAFWMKGMTFPIDIIWLSENRVVGVEEDVPVPPELYFESGLPRYIPDEPVDRVLEVKSGWVKEHQVKIGDTVKYNL